MILNWVLFNESVGEKPIEDFQLYIDGMNKSIDDKLFFLSYIDFDVIVDFGCADGTLLEKIKKMKPEVEVIGYDLDMTMISKARNRLKGSLITNNWNEIMERISHYKSPLLNLSSVIHEVYSYSNSNTIKYFWDNQVFGDNFKYISIRDMIPSTKMGKEEKSSFINDIRKIKRRIDPYYISSFENRWGKLSNNYRTFTHFLLKYRYTDNWDREVNENYLPISLETLKEKIPNGYKIIYEKDFILDFLKQQVFKDLNINILHSTHTKLIIKNTKYKKGV